MTCRRVRRWSRPWQRDAGRRPTLRARRRHPTPSPRTSASSSLAPSLADASAPERSWSASRAKRVAAASMVAASSLAARRGGRGSPRDRTPGARRRDARGDVGRTAFDRVAELRSSAPSRWRRRYGSSRTDTSTRSDASRLSLRDQCSTPARALREYLAAYKSPALDTALPRQIVGRTGRDGEPRSRPAGSDVCLPGSTTRGGRSWRNRRGYRGDLGRTVVLGAA